jgi:hypothetical protein
LSPRTRRLSDSEGSIKGSTAEYAGRTVLSEDLVGRVEILGAEHLVEETRDERERRDA